MPLSKESEARLEALGAQFEAWASEAFSEAKISEAKLQARFFVAVVATVASGYFFLVSVRHLGEVARMANPRLVNEATLLELATLNVAIGGVSFFAFLYLAVLAGTTKGVWGWTAPDPAPKIESAHETDDARRGTSPKKSTGPKEEDRRKKPDPAEEDSGTAFPSIWGGR